LFSCTWFFYYAAFVPVSIFKYQDELPGFFYYAAFVPVSIFKYQDELPGFFIMPLLFLFQL